MNLYWGVALFSWLFVVRVDTDLLGLCNTLIVGDQVFEAELGARPAILEGGE